MSPEEHGACISLNTGLSIKTILMRNSDTRSRSGRLAMQFLTALAATYGCAFGQHITSACELISQCPAYEGKTITVNGEYRANRHDQGLLPDDCPSITGERAVALDWSQHRKRSSEPSLEPLVIDRFPNGRPAFINGFLTIRSRVHCLGRLRTHPGPRSGEAGDDAPCFSVRLSIQEVVAAQPKR